MENGNQSVYPTGDQSPYKPEFGLTKREYFAGLNMQALMTLSNDEHCPTLPAMATMAVEAADALLAALTPNKQS